MIYRVNGRVYAESPSSSHPYTEVAVRMDDNVKTLVPMAGSLDTLPAEAYPMTYAECLASMAPTAEPVAKATKTRRKGGDKDVHPV